MQSRFKTNRRLALVAAASAAITFIASPALAQAPGPPSRCASSCPSRPGGTTDILARAIAPELSKAFGQQFVVETAPARAATWVPTWWPSHPATATRC
jgi:tripartite-type tricarboxylate transporter receptor subunit TctC